MIIGTYIGLIVFILFLIIHLIILSSIRFRFIGRIHLVNKCFFLSIVVIFFIISTLHLTSIFSSYFFMIPYIFAYLTFLCLYILYMPFLFTICTSLSVQSLIIISKNCPQEILISQINSKFTSIDLVKMRLDLMAGNKFLKYENDDKYHLTFKGILFATCFGFLKRLWRLSPGG